MYDKSIDRETYQEQLARLREEQLSVETELNESKVDEFAVESAVNFALHAIGDASRFWLEASLETKNNGSNGHFFLVA